MSTSGLDFAPRCCMFVDDAHTFGGAQIALAWAVRITLQHLPTSVICVCPPNTRTAIEEIVGANDRLRFIDCPPALPLNVFTFPLRLRRFYRIIAPLVNEPNVAWFLNLSGIEFCLAPLLILRFFGLQPVSWLHNNNPFTAFQQHSTFSRKMLSKLRDIAADSLLFRLHSLILTPSRATRDGLAGRIRSLRRPGLGYLYPYIGPSEIGEAPVIKNQPRSNLDLWMIGRIEFVHKNNMVGLELMKHFNETNRPATLNVVGEGPDQEQLKDAITRLEVSNQVTLHGWQRNPWCLVPRSAIVLLPSWYEAMPLVAMEAMRRGIRIMTSPIPAFQEGSPERVIADDFSIHSFSRKIEELAAMDDEEIDALYAIALEKFSEPSYAARLMGFLGFDQQRSYSKPATAKGIGDRL